MEDGSNWGVGGTKYLRHRQHQTVKKPTNRWRVDEVCLYVLGHTELDFKAKPSADHIWFHARAIIFGEEDAMKKLTEARK